jgi:hypothetical protein
VKKILSSLQIASCRLDLALGTQEQGDQIWRIFAHWVILWAGFFNHRLRNVKKLRNTFD